jgi:hypothetical protein
MNGMTDAFLDVLDRQSRDALIVGAVQHFGHRAELNDQIV